MENENLEIQLTERKEKPQEVITNQLHGITTNVFMDKNAFQELFNIAKMFASSALVPQNYQGKPMDCMIAIDMANRIGVSPMMVMQNLYIVKGKPGWSGQACMTLIASCGRFKEIRHIYTGEKGTNTRGCYLQAKRVADGNVINGTEITIEMAKAENWTTNAKWRNMPEQMLAYRASAFFARIHCPEVLMGVQLADEIIDTGKNVFIPNPFEG